MTLSEDAIREVLEETASPIGLTYLTEVLQVEGNRQARSIICSTIQSLNQCKKCDAFETDSCIKSSSMYDVRAETPPSTDAYIIQDMAEMNVTELANILSLTIKEDRTEKIVTFLISLLNYTSHNQQNIGFVSVSSSGKSYIPGEILRLFPKGDVQLVQHQSPKAFYHEEGIIVKDKGGMEYGNPLKSSNDYVSANILLWDEKNPQDITPSWREGRRAETTRLKEIWEKIPKGILVDLSKKILFFLDMPNWHLMSELKPMLSHDAIVTRSSIADKSRSGSLATKTVFLKGFPTVLFATVKTDLDEQVRNRMFLLSAGIDQDKLQASISHYLHTESADSDYLDAISKDEERKLLIERVEGIKAAGIDRILFHDSDLDNIKQWFKDRSKGRYLPRHQRDIKHVLALIKGHALLNHTNRKKNDNCLVPNIDDINTGLALYDEIAISNELGIEPELYSFWKEVLQPLLKGVSGTGITRYEFRKSWFDYAGSQLSDRGLKRKLELLETVNFIEQLKEGREMRIYASVLGGVSARTTDKENSDTQTLIVEEQVLVSEPLKQSAPTTKKEWEKAILSKFGHGLSQCWSLEDLRGEFEKPNYNNIDEAVFSLLQTGVLKEVSPSYYRRAG